MLTYFIRNFLVSQVEPHSKPLISQRFDYFTTVIHLRIGDIEHRHLHRREPGRQSAGMLLDQNADEPLQASHDGTVQHDGPVACPVFAHELCVQALRHVGINLHRATLPLPAQCVFQGVFNFRAVERALARRQLKVTTRCLQPSSQRLLSLVPAFFGSNALFRTRCQLVDDLGKAEIPVHLLQQRGEGHALGLNLVFRAKNVAIVLRERTHPHDPMQPTGGLIAMAVAKLTESKRQIPITLDALLVDQDMSRAVHWLQRIVTLFRLRGEHVFPVLVPVPCLFPERSIQDLRPFDLQVTVVPVNTAHVLLNFLPNRPTLGMPENGAGRVIVDVEEVQLASQLAMVTFFGLLQHGQVLLQLLLGSPRSTVDPLQHFVLVVATPVGAGYFHQFEMLELAGARHVRPPAEIFKLAFTVEGNVLISRNAFNDFGLVVLSQALEIRNSLVAGQHPTYHGFVKRGQGGHLLFDSRQVFRRKGALVGKVVEEAVFDDGPNRHLRFRKQFFDRVGQQMRRRMADHLQAIRVLGRDDRQCAVALDPEAGIDHPAIDLPSQCGLGKPGANGTRHFSDSHGTRKFTLRTIRERNLNHGVFEERSSEKEKSADMPALFRIW